MALGDGIRRNIADVDPTERALLRDAIIEMHRRFFPGLKTDSPPGGVSWWFKQDEIHQATHVHGGPEFIPWHRVLLNKFEEMIRQVNPLLSLHYWDWTQDATFLFTTDFMGAANGDAGDPWLLAGFYVPGADPYRGDSAFDTAHNNPVDPPRTLTRNYTGSTFPNATDNAIVNAVDYKTMWQLLEAAHNSAHGFIGGTLGNSHISFRDPFVFLLHCNVDRLYARWQTDPPHSERLNSDGVYSGLTVDELAQLNENVEPWSTGHGSFHDIRPWSEPGMGEPHTYKDPSVVNPPNYDTNHILGPHLQWSFEGNTNGFGQVADGRPIWIGNFSRSDRAEVLFYFPGDGNWWLGSHNGTELAWSFAGNTNGFGQVADGRPIWIGDFNGNSKSDVLFYFPGDGNWWLGDYH